MIRLTIFIIALLLAMDVMEPTSPWLITLAVLSGIELLHLWRPRLRSRFWFWRRRWTEEFDW